MTQLDRKIRALCLLSGSLDSLLAAKALQEQGVEVHAVTFTSPFFHPSPAQDAAIRLDIPVRSLDFAPHMVRVLNAWHQGGNGAEPPCTNCRAAMLARAGEILSEEKFDFICTGEVLNQRVPTQSEEALKRVAQRSGCGGYVLRPLSANVLPETEVEKQGWVDRNRLPGLEGRSRKGQIELAKQWGITEYPPPAAVCRLTEESFCTRLGDLQAHEGLSGTRQLHLLRLGRHFRLGGATKLVVGRNEQENVELEGNAELYDLVLKVEHAPGPTGLLPFTATPEELQLAAAICARYGDRNGDRTAFVRVRSSRETRRIEVEPAPADVIEMLRI